MSLLPYLYEDFFRPSRLLDQNFGIDLDPEDLFSPISLPQDFRMALRNPFYFRPWRSAASQADTGSTITMDKDKFQVNLDVQQFEPKEITVNVSGDNTVTIEGKHEEKKDEHGYISRHFVRRYVLPKDVDSKQIASTLSLDGVLTVTAPRVGALESEQKSIPITHTGKPAKAVENKKK